MMARILSLFVTFLLFTALVPAQDKSGEAPETDSPKSALFPTITAVLTDDFPLITLVLTKTQNNWEHFHLDNFRVKEEEVAAQILSFTVGRANHSLKIGLIFDHGYLGGVSSEDSLAFWETAKTASAGFLASMEAERDSFLLVSFASGVDNTDFNNNTEVFSMILNSLEPDSGRRIFDAMQVGLEALLPHNGRRIMVLFTSGKDQGSDTPSKTVLQTARLLRIPVYIIATGEADYSALQPLASKTGGSLIYAKNAEELTQAFQQISQQLQNVSELTYITPVPDGTEPLRRTVEVISTISPDLPPQNTKTTYRIDKLPSKDSEILTSPKNRKNLWGMIFAIVVCMGIVAGFIMWRRNRLYSDLVVPAITNITFHRRNNTIRLDVNIPLRNRPVKLTIFTDAGTPVIDAVFPGRKRRYEMDISELPFGVYFCTITNGGLTSEKKHMVKQVV
ncbi:MAG: VWA domain-containing protein [Bacteroidia bacterium]